MAQKRSRSASRNKTPHAKTKATNGSTPPQQQRHAHENSQTNKRNKANHLYGPVRIKLHDEWRVATLVAISHKTATLAYAATDDAASLPAKVDLDDTTIYVADDVGWTVDDARELKPNAVREPEPALVFTSMGAAPSTMLAADVADPITGLVRGSYIETECMADDGVTVVWHPAVVRELLPNGQFKAVINNDEDFVEEYGPDDEGKEWRRDALGRVRPREAVLVEFFSSGRKAIVDKGTVEGLVKHMWKRKTRPEHVKALEAALATRRELLATSFQEYKRKAIGKRVAIYWPLDDEWYPGVIGGYNGASGGQHHVLYDDGNDEWLSLQSEPAHLFRDEAEENEYDAAGREGRCFACMKAGRLARLFSVGAAGSCGMPSVARPASACAPAAAAHILAAIDGKFKPVADAMEFKSADATEDGTAMEVESGTVERAMVDEPADGAAKPFSSASNEPANDAGEPAKADEAAPSTLNEQSAATASSKTATDSTPYGASPSAAAGPSASEGGAIEVEPADSADEPSGEPAATLHVGVAPTTAPSLSAQLGELSRTERLDVEQAGAAVLVAEGKWLKRYPVPSGRPFDGDMVQCAGCRDRFHFRCLPMDLEKREYLLGEWRCIACKRCEVCGEDGTKSRLAVCEECSMGFHMHCLEPALKAFPSRAFKCPRCVRCRSCDTINSPKGWTKDYTLCNPCGRLFRDGAYCPICSKAYSADEGDMVRCDRCNFWVHMSCDTHIEERRSQLSSDDALYTCPNCRGERTATLMLQALEQLQRLDRFRFFAEPVPIEYALAMSYHTVVDEPMDFGTMRDKILSAQYGTQPAEAVANFTKDFRLVCNNAIAFNRPNDKVHQCARRLLKFGEGIVDGTFPWLRRAKLGDADDKGEAIELGVTDAKEPSVATKYKPAPMSPGTALAAAAEDAVPLPVSVWHHAAALAYIDQVESADAMRDACFVCGGLAEPNGSSLADALLLRCSHCAETFHSYCVPAPCPVPNEDTLMSWQCPRCRVMVVGEAASAVAYEATQAPAAQFATLGLKCTNCDRSFPKKALPADIVKSAEDCAAGGTLPIWVCGECRCCRGCGAVESKKWSDDNLWCETCSPAALERRYCGVCSRVYEDTSEEAQLMIQCDACGLWIHMACDGMDEATFALYDNGAPGFERYECPDCCTDARHHMQGATLWCLVERLVSRIQNKRARIQGKGERSSRVSATSASLLDDPVRRALVLRWVRQRSAAGAPWAVRALAESQTRNASSPRTGMSSFGTKPGKGGLFRDANGRPIPRDFMPDCGKCRPCLGKKKFGGDGTLRQACAAKSRALKQIAAGQAPADRNLLDFEEMEVSVPHFDDDISSVPPLSPTASGAAPSTTSAEPPDIVPADRGAGVAGLAGAPVAAVVPPLAPPPEAAIVPYTADSDSFEDYSTDEDYGDLARAPPVVVKKEPNSEKLQTALVATAGASPTTPALEGVAGGTSEVFAPGESADGLQAAEALAPAGSSDSLLVSSVGGVEPDGCGVGAPAATSPSGAAAHDTKSARRNAMDIATEVPRDAHRVPCAAPPEQINAASLGDGSVVKLEEAGEPSVSLPDAADDDDAVGAHTGAEDGGVASESSAHAANVRCGLCSSGSNLVCGRLLPVNCGWVHVNCASWSSEVFEKDTGVLSHVPTALRRAARTPCDWCGVAGASVGCFARRCMRSYHFECARKAGCAYSNDAGRATWCPEHRPSKSLSPLPVKMERSLAIEPSMRMQRVTGVADEGSPESVVLQVGALRVLRFGRPQPARPQFHEQFTIFPLGYKARRRYFDVTSSRPRATCEYVCEIDENAQLPSFIIRHPTDSSLLFRGRSAGEAWSLLVLRRAKVHGVTRLPLIQRQQWLEGLLFFGLAVPAVAQLIEQLPGAKACEGFQPRYSLPEASQKIPPLPKSRNGCARADAVVPRSSKFKANHFVYFRPFINRGALPVECDDPAAPPAVPELTERDGAAVAAGLRQRGEGKGNERRNAEEVVSIFSTKKVAITDDALRMLHRNVSVRRSAIHNWGLFTTRAIGKDSMVIEYRGEAIRSIIADQKERQYGEGALKGQGGDCYMFRVDEDLVLDATMKGNVARFINHCCTPNCYSKVVEVDGKKHIVIFAARDLEMNEEVQYDYKFAVEREKIVCHCGSPKCLGVMN